MSNDDPSSHKKALEFINDKLDLKLDFKDINASIQRQNEKLELLRRSAMDINETISKLENGQLLSEEERENLVKAVDDCLRKRNN
jgi:cell division protein FtsB